VPGTPGAGVDEARPLAGEAVDAASPVPNPPPVPSDLPPPRLVTPGGALRRSLLVWGWGQVASGDRRGWALPPLQVLAVAAVVGIAPSLVDGVGASLAFAAGAALLLAWGGVAVHAHRRAARRRARLDLPAVDRSAMPLLWLAPVAIVASTGFWAVAAGAAEPASVVAAYVADWEAGRAAAAGARFVDPPATDDLRAVWLEQRSELRNALVRLEPKAGPGGGVNPDQPLDTIRWVDGGETAAGTRLIHAEVTQRETVRGLVLGLLPVTSQRLVPLQRLGLAELRRVPAGDGLLPPGPWSEEWRLVRVEIEGIVLGRDGG
jgi:hypothetical protein